MTVVSERARDAFSLATKTRTLNIRLQIIRRRERATSPYPIEEQVELSIRLVKLEFLLLS
jgi:hypothetical protein